MSPPVPKVRAIRVIECIIRAEDAGKRLDAAAAEYALISRSYAKNLINEGRVSVNGASSKASYTVRESDRIRVEIPEPEVLDAQPQDIALDVVYEDCDLIVINKPRGMVVHPAPGHGEGTLVNALLHHCGDLSGIGGSMRPGIVHRIDKDTTGLIAVAKNDAAHQSLSAQIKQKAASRDYYALVEGVVKTGGTVSQPIGRHRTDRKKMAVVNGGRSAVTHYSVKESYGEYTLLDVSLETGRTHQIRVHMAYIGHPVVGDSVYGRKKQKFSLQGQMLHAYHLKLTHPVSGEVMDFYAPLPTDFESVVNILRSYE